MEDFMAVPGLGTSTLRICEEHIFRGAVLGWRGDGGASGDDEEGGQRGE